MENIRTLVALDRGVPRDVVDTALPPTSDIHVVGVVDGLSEGWKVLQETSPDLLVIICAGESDHALLLVDRATKERPDRPVVVLAEGVQNGYVQRVFEAGADDIVTLPESPDRIQFSLTKAVARKQQSAAAAGASAPLVSILGPKGGTGKTLTAGQPRGVAARRRASGCVVVDLDLQFGDLGLALGLRPERTIVRPRERRRLARRREGRGLHDRARSGVRVAARADAAGAGRLRHRRVPARRSTRRCARRTTT